MIYLTLFPQFWLTAWSTWSQPIQCCHYVVIPEPISPKSAQKNDNALC